MRLEEYIEAMLPTVILIDNEKKIDSKGYKRQQIWYIYRQYFYGFAEFIDRKILINVSREAQKMFEKIYSNKQLYDQDWRDQPHFDENRKLFNLDHIYTGQMFRNSIQTLISENKLSVEEISNLIKSNYRMAWILKEEERRLPRSNRGKTLNDALKVYEHCKIELINKSFG